MAGFLETIFSFPTILFTALLGLFIPYWLLVILGALDLDFLDGLLGIDAIDGALEGLDGAIDGALDAGVEGAVEGAIDGGLDSAAEAAEAVDGGARGGFAGLLHILGVGGVPITIIASMLVVSAWFLSYAGTKLVTAVGTGPLMQSVGAWAVLLVTLLGSFTLTSLSTRPLRRVFKTRQAPRMASLVGQLCTITTGNVDAEFGQGEIKGGAGYIVQVRCSRSNELKRGDKAVVYSYDPRRGVFEVAPPDPALVASVRADDV